MSSSRLPGKVLMEFIDGETVLWKVYCHARRVRYFQDVIVLTSEEKSDDPVEVFCTKKGISFLRGSLDDVYSRFCGALNSLSCDGFARVCADSPFIDEVLLNFASEIFLKEQDCVYVSNTIERTFPKGLSVQISNSAEFLSTGYTLSDTFSSEHICNGFDSSIYNQKRINIFTRQSFDRDSYALDNKDDLKFLNLKPNIGVEQTKLYFKRM